MIQTDTFEHARQIARLLLGSNWKTSYLYWSDTKRQWESSHSSSKAVELIGSQSAPKYTLLDARKRVGGMSSDEQTFVDKFTEFYRDISKLETSREIPVESEIDMLETVTDLRMLADYVLYPCRVLDIGPGAGRNMASLFLEDVRKKSAYVGVEAIGIPYSMQNLAASMLTMRDPDLSFYEFFDYYFDRLDFPISGTLPDGSIWHLPLWEAERLPKGVFDVVICNYLLDELAPDDFDRVMTLISKSLSGNGVLYCRGSQHRSMQSSLYLYGHGTRHGRDITGTILSLELKLVFDDTEGGIMTRIFARTDSNVPMKKCKYGDIQDDMTLVECVQKDFIKERLDELTNSRAKVMVWGEGGYAEYSRYIAPLWDNLDIVAMTHRMVFSEGVNQFGYREVPVTELVTIDADCIIVASDRFRSIYREIKEMTEGTGKYERVQHYSLPIAFIHRD